MAKLVAKAAVIKTEGTPVEEIVGRLSTKTADISFARMHSRRGWVDHEQKRQFAEYILVFKGALHVKTRRQRLVARAGQAVAIRAGEWVQYSTPEAGGAHYLAVCVPAFDPDLVQRKPDLPARHSPSRAQSRRVDRS
jgi:ethanolamine utilization protein EutQ (cupin superfamily)